MSRNEIAVFCFSRLVENCEPVFQSSFDNLHSHAPVLQHPFQHLVLSVFLLLTILVGVEQLSHCGINLHFSDD